MKNTQATAEDFLSAFRALSRPQREAVVSHLLKDRGFAADLEDIVLIEKSRREKGKDTSLDEYVRLRKKNAG